MESRRILRDLFKAYYDARKNKRRSVGAMAFEINYESKLLKLYKDLISGNYRIGPSTCFISFKPLMREIFAADFRDRVVHHLIYNYISPIFEKSFIHDSYSCRKGRGTSCGIRRLNHFICSCSRNYSRDCYVLKLDISSYFMSIDKGILYKKIVQAITRTTHKNGAFSSMLARNWLLSLIRQVIFHDPTEDCVIKGKREDWRNLPESKSLFHAVVNRGLPIGNLTSQLFGNIYLDDFDHFVRYRLGCKYYGRYVDDIVIVHKNKDYLTSIIPVIRTYLKNNLLLKLHPRKIYLQDVKNGAPFLGTIIKPYRIYICHKTKSNFYQKINWWNELYATGFSAERRRKFVASINSYLGMLGQFDTYRLRRKMLMEELSSEIRQNIVIAEDYCTISHGVFDSKVL